VLLVVFGVWLVSGAVVEGVSDPLALAILVIGGLVAVAPWTLPVLARRLRSLPGRLRAALGWLLISLGVALAVVGFLSAYLILVLVPVGAFVVVAGLRVTRLRADA
jgi:hypothetical protein